jgi:hypothetical protein
MSIWNVNCMFQKLAIGFFVHSPSATWKRSILFKSRASIQMLNTAFCFCYGNTERLVHLTMNCFSFIWMLKHCFIYILCLFTSLFRHIHVYLKTKASIDNSFFFLWSVHSSFALFTQFQWIKKQTKTRSKAQ